MCTRYVLYQEHLREILDRLGMAGATGFSTRYNIAPGSLIPAARSSAQAVQPEAVLLRWGLVPAWAKEDIGCKLLNARAETIASKPAFRDALRKRRCVIPASGFYEWQSVGHLKQPWLIRRRNQQPFAFAGLWESWRAPDGATLETCTIVTTEPNELMRPIHSRMPVMLAPEQFAPWLDARTTQSEKLAPLLHPAPAATMSAIAVSRRVSNVRHDDPACLAPAEAQDDPSQFSLGL